MAQHVEPMDIDSSVCEFDNKENTCLSNVLPRTPCTEKGYEELDVSELNMKLRYSVTPANSPMSKSYTGNSLDNRNFEIGDFNENGNLARSLHSALPPDSLVRPQKVIPLQSIPADQLETSRSALRSLDSTITTDNGNITVTVSGTNDVENVSFPSSSSSMAHTPEATTPTKEIPKSDGSPILRGLKSVLSMFRPSQSPIPPENENETANEVLSPPIVASPDTTAEVRQAVLASTPLNAQRTKRNSPNRDSLVFNEDLERELEWKDETTILFSKEKIPIHKLFFQHTKPEAKPTPAKIYDEKKQDVEEILDTTVEFMDVSYNDSIRDKTLSEIQVEIINRSDVNIATESDSEFVDCETTFSNNKSQSSFKSQDIDLEDTREIKQLLNITNETLDATVSEKSSDISTETARASINNSISENVPAPEVLETDVKTEDIKAVSSTTDLSLACKSQFNITEDNTQHKTQVEFEKPNLNVTLPIETPIVSNESIVTLDHGPKDIATNISVKNSSDVQPNVTAVTDIANSSSSLGVLSQIPLLADPRVLLFNLSQDPVNDIRESQSTDNTLGTLPVDIPLPDDDDDIDKMISLLNEYSKTNNLEIPTDFLNNIQVNGEQSVVNEISKTAPIETEIADYDSLPEVKDLFANIALNRDILKPESNLALISSAFITNEKFFIESNAITTVNKNIEAEVKAQDITPMTVNEEIVENTKVKASTNIDQTKIVCVADDKAVNCNAYIPEVEDNIPFDLNETPDLPQIISQGSSVTERKEPELEHPKVLIALVNESLNENVKVPSCDIVNQSPVKASITEDILVKAEDEIANDSIQIAPSTKTENVPLHDAVSEKVTALDNDAVMQKSVATPAAVAEEVKMDITFDEEKNESVKEIALEIVNKTIEMAISPIVEKIETGLPLKDNKVIEIMTVPPNVISEVDALNSSPVTIKEEIKLTAEETAIVSRYISNQTDIVELTNAENAAMVDPISRNKNSEVPEIITSEETQTNIDVNKADNITVVSLKEETTKDDQPLNTNDHLTENNEKKIDIVDEEIIASENNSPFVSVTADSEIVSEAQQMENFEKIENPFETKTTTVSPPISPKIVSRGYNFNFDEMDDPFGTKTKIRQSPPPGATSNQSIDQLDTSFGKTDFTKRDLNKNRRKSQPERKKPGNVNKKLNSTVVGAMSVNQKTSLKEESIQEPDVEKIEHNVPLLTTHLNATKDVMNNVIASTPGLPVEQIEHDVSMTELPEILNNKFDGIVGSKHISMREPEIGKSTFDGKEVVNENKPEAFNITSEIKHEDTLKIDSVVKTATGLNTESQSSIENENKNSSSDHSSYFSAGTSSSELVGPKNVFNLPEIDDINFNPCVAMSKMRQSPPPGLQNEKPIATKMEDIHARDSTMIIDQKDDIHLNPFATKSKMRQSPPPGLPIANTIEEMKAADSTVIIENNHDAIMNITSPKESSVTVDKMTEEKHETGQEEKDFLNNISNETCASKATDDKDNTVREINTEDEDTIEGPFLEAEDLNNDDKMSDFDGENVDMMKFTDTPPQENDDNADAGELFIDAEAFEFLLNQNKSNMVADSGKESLFLKFDPLFAKRMSSDGVLAALSKVQKRQSTPKKMAKPNKDATFVQKSPIAGPSNMNLTCGLDNNQDESNDDLNITVSKPMMVVNPAINPVVTPRNKSLTPTRTNRRSLTFTSPAIAVIDRLLSMSASNSLMGHETTVTEVSREQNEADLALTQLRELLADKEINVYNLRTESKQLKDRLASLESQMKSLEATSEERLKKINELTDRLNEKTKLNRSMATVVEEYERTIASLISETEQDKKRHAQERIELMKERDEQTAHLASMEVSFSDLHSKYEKSKQVILGFKTNEDTYKKSIKEFEESLTKMQNNYESLKQHATSKLNHANDELQKMNRAHEAEVLKLNAMIKRKELHITSLEETLLQKTKANEELTAICDELINKVG